MITHKQLLQIITDAGVVAMLRASKTDRAVAAGGELIEVTFTAPDAQSALRQMRERYGDSALLGAVTVTSSAYGDRSMAAGTGFLVASEHRAEVTAATVSSGALTMISAFTAPEVMAVTAAGVDIVDFFPGDIAGPAGLKTLRDAFPQPCFESTGGVAAPNLADWFALGAIGVGSGSELASLLAVEGRDLGPRADLSLLHRGRAGTRRDLLCRQARLRDCQARL